MKKTLILSCLLFLGLAVKSQGQNVYASEKGEKYHTADCRLSGDAKDMTLVAAKKANKNACGVCKPDEHLKDKTVQCEGKTAEGTRVKE